jgi:hypothetical protein
MGIRINPLQQGFDGHSRASLPVRVDDKAALHAPEQGVVFPSCPFFATAPFRPAIGINAVQRNAVVKTTGFEYPSENVGRNGQNVLELSSLGLKLGKPFNRYVGVEPARKEDYFPHQLPRVSVNKISWRSQEYSLLMEIRRLVSAAASFSNWEKRLCLNLVATVWRRIALPSECPRQ